MNNLVSHETNITPDAISHTNLDVPDNPPKPTPTEVLRPTKQSVPSRGAVIKELDEALRAQIEDEERNATQRALNVLRDFFGTTTQGGFEFRQNYASQPVGAVVSGGPERWGPRTVTEGGVTPAAVNDLAVTGNAVNFLPNAVRGVAQPKDLRIPVAVQESTNQANEVRAMAREIPRAAVWGNENQLFAAVHRPAAAIADAVSIHGILVQLHAAREALQSGAQASLRPYRGFQVRLGLITDRPALQASPQYGSWTFVVAPSLSASGLGLLATLFGVGGVSNYRWAWNGEHLNDDPDVMIHSISRNHINQGFNKILLLVNSMPAEPVPIYGGAFTQASVNELLERFSSLVPNTEMESASVAAIHYIMMYRPPVLDIEPVNAAEIGTGNAVGRYPARNGVDIPPPDQRGGPAPPAAPPIFGLPDVDGDGWPIEPAVAYAMRTEPDGVAERNQNMMRAARMFISSNNWDDAEEHFVPGGTENFGVSIRIRAYSDDIQWPYDNRWNYFELDDAGHEVYETWVGPAELVGFGRASQAEVYRWFEGHFEWRYVQEEPNTPTDPGPYAAPRNVYGAIDHATKWDFSAFEVAHVVGVLTGFYDVIGAGLARRSVNDREYYAAARGVANQIHWMWHATLYSRGIDSTYMIRRTHSGGEVMRNMPGALMSITGPKDLSRAMYPWGGLECLEVVPLVVGENNSPYIGYAVNGEIDGAREHRHVYANSNMSRNNRSKLDAWARLTVSRTRLLSVYPFVVRPFAMYSVGSNGRLYHPFVLPFLYVRRMGGVGNDPLALPDAEDSAVFEAAPALVPNPWVDFTLDHAYRVGR